MPVCFVNSLSDGWSFLFFGFTSMYSGQLAKLSWPACFLSAQKFFAAAEAEVPVAPFLLDTPHAASAMARADAPPSCNMLRRLRRGLSNPRRTSAGRSSGVGTSGMADPPQREWARAVGRSSAPPEWE